MLREPSHYAASLLLLAAIPVQDAQRWIVEVEPEARARTGALVVLELPPVLAACDSLRVLQSEQSLEVSVPSQRVSGPPERLIWRLPDEARRFVVEPGEPIPVLPYRVEAVDGELALWHKIDFSKVADRELARYRPSTVAPPEGVDPVYARGGYLHPLLTPSGHAVTGDFPPAHRHHHGVWTAWTRTRFEGSAVDFWNSTERQGRVEAVDVLDASAGHYFSHLRTSLRHVDLTGPDGERVALNEVWDVRAFALEDATVVDLDLEQRCATDCPLELLEYHYGGLGWRGPVGWEGDACRFLTSEGLDRLEGHATRARWCAITGLVDGEPVTAAILGHPANFRAPQPMRLHPDEPFFCYAPEQLGPFSITPEEPYRARYRLLAMDGEPDVERIEELWREWAEPLRARIVER